MRMVCSTGGTGGDLRTDRTSSPLDDDHPGARCDAAAIGRTVGEHGGAGEQAKGRGPHMTEQVSPQYRSAARAEEAPSGAAVGFILFAAIMMIMAGVFQAISGLVAIFQNEFYVATANYLFIPYYPFWALTIITLDIFVIWAIAAHGGELRDQSA